MHLHSSSDPNKQVRTSDVLAAETNTKSKGICFAATKTKEKPKAIY